MAEKTDEEKFLETHQRERDILFANEAFVIGVLQAVSGGSSPVSGPPLTDNVRRHHDHCRRPTGRA